MSEDNLPDPRDTRNPQAGRPRLLDLFCGAGGAAMGYETGLGKWMAKPRLLDLFCGAGGASVGYHHAGFDVVGVDIKPQPRYPFEFHQADAMTFPLDGYEVIHASPPCQGYSSMRHLPWVRDKTYPMLLAPAWERLTEHGKPFVIENVERAPMPSSIVLCGVMFGLPMYRHRRFGSNVCLFQPQHEKHLRVLEPGGASLSRRYHKVSEVAGVMVAVYGDHPEDAPIHRRGFAAGHLTWRAASVEVAQRAMGIDWMDWRELTQAIPPAYTNWIGEQLIRTLR